MGTVVLGITGCIAAYKACELVRLLQTAGANVKVVMTRHACEFVGPATFRALSGNEVAIDLFEDPKNPIHHISLAKEADVFCIVPATANCVAKLARGVADDLLTTTALALPATTSRLIAPAMNSAMYENETTQQNIRALKANAWEVVEPQVGHLACGDVGRGHLADINCIAEAILALMKRKRDFANKKFLITAGPTKEAIDPVRCITNHSSGIMGYALAAEAACRGADVTLVSGPVSLPVPQYLDFVPVTSAQEMFEASKSAFDAADYACFVAAVSDWRPKDVKRTKIKHNGNGITLDLVPNPDIAQTLAKSKGNRRVVVFAAETQDTLNAAKAKLEAKNADMVVANNVSGELGFGTGENKVWLVSRGFEKELPVLSKREIAKIILDEIAKM